jgi:hypothetical protein
MRWWLAKGRAVDGSGGAGVNAHGYAPPITEQPGRPSSFPRGGQVIQTSSNDDAGHATVLDEITHRHF